MDDRLRKRIIRAAVAWERAAHEGHERYQVRDTKVQEDELAAAVQSYNAQLVADDAGEDDEIPAV